MKYIKYIIILASFFLVSISFVSCEKDEEFTSDKEIIRGAVSLTEEFIPVLKEWPIIMIGGHPIVYYKGQDDYIVRYCYHWIRTSDGSLVTGELSANFVVTESDERALEYLEESRDYNYSCQMCLDEPTLVGDISYGNSRLFKRNNIVVEIDASWEVAFKEIGVFAQQIDSLILDGPKFTSRFEVKPLITDFKIGNNTVFAETKTLVTLEVDDPINKNMYYSWKSKYISGERDGYFVQDEGAGILMKDNGDLYFMSGCYCTTFPVSEQEITLYVVNEYGFAADSTILLKTIKQ